MNFMIGTIITILLILLIISIFYVVKFGIIILQVQDSIEESLDILDERYASMQKIIETPLFYDSPEIRRVLSDIALTRDAIIMIADSLTVIGDSAKIESESEEE